MRHKIKSQIWWWLKLELFVAFHQKNAIDFSNDWRSGLGRAKKLSEKSTT
jgi:hypothetical protein